MKRSLCIYFDNLLPRVNITLHGTAISWKEKVKHLYLRPTWFRRRGPQNCYMLYRRSIDWMSNKVSRLVKDNLSQAYHCSWYGSRTWIQTVNMCFNLISNGIRLSDGQKIQYVTHIRLLAHIVNSLFFRDQHARQVKNSEKLHLHFTDERALRNAIRVMGRNCAELAISSSVSISDNVHATFLT